MLLYNRNIIGSPSEIFGYLRKSLTIFGKCLETFVWPLEQFWKIFGNLQKVVGNLWKSTKTLSLVCLYDKQNITCLLVDMNFIFSCSTRYLTGLLRSLVSYWVEHLKIKFESMHAHVISSISLAVKYQIYVQNLHYTIMQSVLGVLYIKTIQIIYSWDCIMLQWTGYPLF